MLEQGDDGEDVEGGDDHDDHLLVPELDMMDGGGAEDGAGAGDVATGDHAALNRSH